MWCVHVFSLSSVINQKAPPRRTCTHSKETAAPCACEMCERARGGGQICCCGFCDKLGYFSQTPKARVLKRKRRKQRCCYCAAALRGNSKSATTRLTDSCTSLSLSPAKRNRNIVGGVRRLRVRVGGGGGGCVCKNVCAKAALCEKTWGLCIQL